MILRTLITQFDLSTKIWHYEICWNGKGTHTGSVIEYPFGQRIRVQCFGKSILAQHFCTKNERVYSDCTGFQLKVELNFNDLFWILVLTRWASVTKFPFRISDYNKKVCFLTLLRLWWSLYIVLATIKRFLITFLINLFCLQLILFLLHFISFHFPSFLIFLFFCCIMIFFPPFPFLPFNELQTQRSR